MHTKQTLLLLLFAVLFLLGCKEKAADEGLSAAPPDTVALNYYNLRAAGRYADYVSAMASCDKATPAYRAQILADQHLAVSRFAWLWLLGLKIKIVEIVKF